MRAIIVDDEPIMARYFLRESSGIPDLEVISSFSSGPEALEFVKENPVEVAFLDVEMPYMTGLELAVRLRELDEDMFIVFVSAFDYIKESNRAGGDYYLEKPCDRESIELMMEKLRDPDRRVKKKSYYLQMSGTFNVLKDESPIPLRGKSGEILAYLAVLRGREAGSRDIYAAVWNRPYGLLGKAAFSHALRVLKNTLEESFASELLISNAKGYSFNASAADCDFYVWQDTDGAGGGKSSGVFLPEYSWSGKVLAEITGKMTRQR